MRPWVHTRTDIGDFFRNLRLDDSWEEGFYSVARVLDHRTVRGGGIEYEVEWKEKKRNGEPWPTDWLSADALTPDLIAAYETKRGHGVPSKLVTIECAQIYEECRRKVADTAQQGSPTKLGFNGANRPRVHRIPLQCLVLVDIARAVLDIARRHGGPPIALNKGKEGEADAWWQLQITDISRIAAFCNFQQFLDSVRSVGNVRLTGNKKHSGDLMVIGAPIILTVKTVRPGIAASFLEFPTVHINGSTGRPTYPHMGTGLLKSEAVRRELLVHVRESLPQQHPLRASGWAALPADVAALAVEYAVPADPRHRWRVAAAAVVALVAVARAAAVERDASAQAEREILYYAIDMVKSPIITDTLQLHHAYSNHLGLWRALLPRGLEPYNFVL